MKSEIPREEVKYYEKESIKEYHFHVYFFQNRKESVADAERIRKEIINGVEEGEFVAVCHGVTSDMLPGLNETEIPPVNYGPIGPHPIGSFETWVPQEYLAQAMSFFMLRRNELSILVHPLTPNALEDHSGRAMFLGLIPPQNKCDDHGLRAGIKAHKIICYVVIFLILNGGN